MKETTAQALTAMLLRHGAEQDAMLAQVRAEEPPEEFLRIRAMIGQTMGTTGTPGKAMGAGGHRGSGAGHEWVCGVSVIRLMPSVC